jgi:hypothetical protein
MSDGKPEWMKQLKKTAPLKKVETKGEAAKGGMSEYAKQQFRREQAAKADGKSFTEALDEKSLVSSNSSLIVSLIAAIYLFLGLLQRSLCSSLC